MYILKIGKVQMFLDSKTLRAAKNRASRLYWSTAHERVDFFHVVDCSTGKEYGYCTIMGRWIG